MSASLADKIRQARESSVEVMGKRFSYRRPTDIQMASMHAEFDGKYSKYEVAKRFVFGWQGVTERDLISEGSDNDASFDVFPDWLEDARDYWTPLYEAIMGAYLEYSESREEAEKHKRPGLSRSIQVLSQGS